jgi:hypothetical protein
MLLLVSPQQKSALRPISISIDLQSRFLLRRLIRLGQQPNAHQRSRARVPFES